MVYVSSSSIIDEDGGRATSDERVGSEAICASGSWRGY